MRKGDKKNRKRKKTVGMKDLPLKATGGAHAKGGATAKPNLYNYCTSGQHIKEVTLD